jgi:hypothetical protein
VEGKLAERRELEGREAGLGGGGGFRAEEGLRAEEVRDAGVERRRVGWQNVDRRTVERLVGGGGGVRAERRGLRGGGREAKGLGQRVGWQRVKRWRRRVAEAREVEV